VDVKKNRRGLLLSPQAISDGELIGARLGRSHLTSRVVPGSGLIHLGDGQLIAVQVPRAAT
jgi:S-DNA-T family DNA segregation ATPase FtsK/SpoIIIE